MMNLKKIKNIFQKKIKTKDKLLRSILCGIYKLKIDYKNGLEQKKEIALFNIPILRAEIDFRLGIRKTYFLVWKIKHEELLRKIEQYIRYVITKKSLEQKKYVFILNANAGEVALFLKYLFCSILKKEQICSLNECIFLCKSKYHIDMVKLLYPSVLAVQIRYSPEMRLFYKKLSLGELQVFKFFPLSYFTDITNTRHTSLTHFFIGMKKWCQVDENEVAIIKTKEYFCKEKEVLKKIKDWGLDINKTILIFPNAQSSDQLQKSFWQKEKKGLEKLGWHVWINEDDPQKRQFLTFYELYIFSEHARYIYGLRSGVMDFLSITKTPMLILYTSSGHKISAEDMLSLFSLNFVKHKSIHEKIFQEGISYVERINQSILSTTSGESN